MLKELGNKRGTIKIGCSKASCYWCDAYLSALNKQSSERQFEPRIVYTATHGKRAKGWLLPDEDVRARTEVAWRMGQLDLLTNIGKVTVR